MMDFFDVGLGAFSAEELDRLERYCDGLPLAQGALGHGQAVAAIRVAQIAGIYQTPESQWFFDRLGPIVRTFNDRSYRFDLRGLFEPPQFLVYREAEGGHYDWHMDIGRVQPRKLSLTIQLTDPARYEGCELQFNRGTEIVSAPRDRGAAIAFPSFLLHRVTPIKSGVRKAIVVWITGPEFK